MRYRLLVAPWWVLALIQGTFFGVFMALFAQPHDPEAFGGGAVGLIFTALVAGLPFGLLMGPAMVRINRRATTAAGLNDPGELAIVSRATTRGPVPTDPRLRAAARNLASHRLDELRRMRNFYLAVFGLGTLGYVMAAILWSRWWALAAVMFAGLLAYGLILPGQLERRIDLLTEPV
jgi:hypothetical protein